MVDKFVFLSGGVFTDRVEDFLSSHSKVRLLDKPAPLDLLLRTIDALSTVEVPST